jgi:hypothetical protein
VLFDGVALFRSTVSDTRSISLAAGDTIDFTLGRGPDNNDAWDRIVLSAQIRASAVPEPSGLVSAALGLAALAGYIGWKRVRSERKKE